MFSFLWPRTPALPKPLRHLIDKNAEALARITQLENNVVELQLADHKLRGADTALTNSQAKLHASLADFIACQTEINSTLLSCVNKPRKTRKPDGRGLPGEEAKT